MKNEHVNSEYMKRLSEILADSGFAITIVGPDGPILGTKADILAIDDMSDMDRTALKAATFSLNYHGDIPLEQVDFSALENRIMAAWELGDIHGLINHTRTRRNGKTCTLYDYHVIKRKRVVQQKQWETKAAIKSRQLRNRQKG